MINLGKRSRVLENRSLGPGPSYKTDMNNDALAKSPVSGESEPFIINELSKLQLESEGSREDANIMRNSHGK
jgi:hypothetical protein